MNSDPIAVIGLWHLGLVSASVLADLGHKVIGYDPDEDLVQKLNRGQLPLYEPGLEKLIDVNREKGRLEFSHDPKQAFLNAQAVLVTYDTPVDEEDRVNLSILNLTFKKMIPLLRQDCLVIVNSQVPAGSCEKWQAQIREERPNTEIDVAYSPENLRLGQAIELYKKPDLIVIGTNSQRALKKAEIFYRSFQSEKFYVSLRTAEMSKHILNAFFATSISFANEVGNLCDVIGADGVQIAKILRSDSRIGKKAQVRPGMGFAGATLARDVRVLQDLGIQWKVPTQLTDSVFAVNEKQTSQLIALVLRFFNNDLKGKVLTVFGLTYKPGTSTLRRSTSLEIIQELTGLGARLKAHDPKANLEEYQGPRSFEFYQDAYEACRDSDGILVLTQWPEYRTLDYGRIRTLMKHTLIFDPQSHLSDLQMEQTGFNYLAVGRGQLVAEGAQ